MDITLPSGTVVTLRSFPRGKHVELVRLNAARAADEQLSVQGDAEATQRLLSDTFFTAREAAMAALYPELAPWADLPNRDAQSLINATWSYSVGLPEDEIKNWSRSGDTLQSQTAPTTAAPAEPMQP